MYACFDCGHLDKSRKKLSDTGTHYNYGCNLLGRSHTCGDVSNDSELRKQGCSGWIEKSNKPEQISIFELA